MDTLHSEEPNGRSLGDALVSLADRLAGPPRTLTIGPATALNLTKLLTEDHVVYQTVLASVRSTECEREVAAIRLIAIEEILGQLGAQS